MPVEECGNMLLSAASLFECEGSDEFTWKEKALLDKWADYLLVNGYDPGNQLCMDDFAGHLAYNYNLEHEGYRNVGGVR